MTSPARIATLHRVSTIDQNPRLAREELREAAGRMGKLVMEVEEVGSGARNDRPGLQRVLAAARKGAIDVVMVWKLDRFGRSTLDLLANIEQLQAAGVRFLATTQGLDIKPGGDSMSKLMLTLLAGVAEFERDIIRERTRLGLAAARRRGVRLGGRPALSAAQVAKVRSLRAKGQSWAEVAAGAGCSTGSARRAVAGTNGYGRTSQASP